MDINLVIARLIFDLTRSRGWRFGTANLSTNIMFIRHQHVKFRQKQHPPKNGKEWNEAMNSMTLEEWQCTLQTTRQQCSRRVSSSSR